ncbi:hypothetical protein FD51_GL001294 [Lacticaseibacillus zeae DSM 20178 = KCTC 3804]|jgi:predicted DNA-binding protein|uniref:CopG family transcriptional regulator n=2 Tax=Lacticaseibacillus zeae TaxID=57037 RepID=A0A5R8LW62_LACZE|nr:DUF6290 family protein [Lacticaseibacillus zeae]KRK13103.1 hypothetical protein FD51_GL001294 [Lacticaseibacillus zeae DSM 20178 = KCTC 3804]OLS06827.1 hypothetical protein AUQ39_09600 [Lacticaseibacillus casei]QVI31933.1 hypothetical protein KG087_13900 [Lacticaseibacillus zeae]TLF41498.1 hypothetical protein FEI14_08865 [Lacticaseibacillus zeae]
MTDTTVISLQFKDDQYKKVKELADSHGVSVTQYMRDAVLKRVADEEDYAAAMANLNASHGKTVYRTEIRKRLGLS